MSKSHDEIVFLYDMLNDKQEKVSELTKELQLMQSAVTQMEQLLDDKIALVEEQSAGQVELAYEEEQREADPTLEDAFKTQLTDAMDKEDSRDNSEILQLYKEGVSEVEIAKKLGRGLGEIKLVLGLFGEEQNE